MREDLTLENGRLKLTTRTRAGQMRSLIDKKNGFELIYQEIRDGRIRIRLSFLWSEAPGMMESLL